MNFVERVVSFACEGEQLLGILAEPSSPSPTGVLVVVGGPQYRVGSHRQFLLLARKLASDGLVVMRFDCRGMGDGSGPLLGFEDFGPDIAGAISALISECPGLERIVLWGLCDAASAILAYWHATRDSRVAGMVLLNPWVRSEGSIARTQIKHYYGKRIFDPVFWKRLGSGDVNLIGAVGGLSRSIGAAIRHKSPLLETDAPATFQDRMADGLRSFKRPVLLILSGRDLTAKEFVEYSSARPRWAELLDRPNVLRLDISDADHTFSSANWRGQVELATLEWLRDNKFQTER